MKPALAIAARIKHYLATLLLSVAPFLVHAAAPTQLTDAIHAKVKALSASGDALVAQGKTREGVEAYVKALGVLPKPYTEWEAATWLLVAIGDANFKSKHYEQARLALQDAMHCPGAIGNPFIHLRLGQTQFELGNMTAAADELARAYIHEGKAIFKEDDPKYLAFIKSKLKPPPGGWPAGW
ncbi:tetratricopeptide repeat protein [Massilia sp. DJPM01]|uniref:tetratricopeptide repeat protein n=1 Tax=Massilia sp. DJPM01 TaxID=3024404 RepID=UPI00259F0971|nr:tetratricopeptide repeat protein [Massilia sp. DJPM01]MDM5176013.1 tetratricopeptide repeat protein [Massilia sp. DJPM01]